MMKKAISTMVLFACCICLHAQKHITKFMEIPVDGDKSEMIRKIKEKGYKSKLSDRETLTGDFNGYDVEIQVVTYKDKVYRVFISDANPTDATNIKVRFNRLVTQFSAKEEYIAYKNQTIPENEDVEYEITTNKKRYEAIFGQKSADANFTKRTVWFYIDENMGTYKILMYYDNEYNKAQGEDL